MNEKVRARIVAALLEQKKSRGRPKKKNLTDIDTQRAALVVWCLTEHPNRFRTRREAIGFLQSLCRAANCLVEQAEQISIEPEWRDALKSAAMTFPLRELEQSVSRGMNKHGGLLRELEKLAKKYR
jgi:hypothetical protein